MNPATNTNTCVSSGRVWRREIATDTYCWPAAIFSPAVADLSRAPPQAAVPRRAEHSVSVPLFAAFAVVLALLQKLIAGPLKQVCQKRPGPPAGALGSSTERPSSLRGYLTLHKTPQYGTATRHMPPCGHARSPAASRLPRPLHLRALQMSRLRPRCTIVAAAALPSRRARGAMCVARGEHARGRGGGGGRGEGGRDDGRVVGGDRGSSHAVVFREISNAVRIVLSNSQRLWIRCTFLESRGREP